ncbi:hypothetical protein G6F59_016533 [Rhizopus arrhizus]|nr:hypothetical protein G6F59_016533 [Rhizopus arrhizus]
MHVEEIAGFQQFGFDVIALHEQDAVLNIAVGRDDDQQHSLVGQPDEFDLAEHLGALGRKHHAGELRQVRQQRGRGIDGAGGFGGRQHFAHVVRLQLIGLHGQQGIDEHAIAPRRGNSAGGRMRAMDQPQLFKVRHHIADRGRGQVEDFR